MQRCGLIVMKKFLASAYGPTAVTYEARAGKLCCFYAINSFFNK
jgi:hypothetical protein